MWNNLRDESQFVNKGWLTTKKCTSVYSLSGFFKQLIYTFFKSSFKLAIDNFSWAFSFTKPSFQTFWKNNGHKKCILIPNQWMYTIDFLLYNGWVESKSKNWWQPMGLQYKYISSLLSTILTLASKNN